MVKNDNYTIFEKHVLKTYDQLWDRLKEYEDMIQKADISGGADALHYNLLLETLRELIEQVSTLTKATEITDQTILSREAELYEKLEALEHRFNEIEKLFMFYADNAEAYEITTKTRNLIELDILSKKETPFTVNLTLTGLSTVETNLHVDFYVNGRKSKNVIEPVISAHCFSIGIPLLDELHEGTNNLQIRLNAKDGLLNVDAFCSRIMICGVGILNAEQVITQKVAERIPYQVQKCHYDIS